MTRVTRSVFASSGRNGLLMAADTCTAPAPPGDDIKVAGGPAGKSASGENTPAAAR